jgi:hypothetical protein
VVLIGRLLECHVEEGGKAGVSDKEQDPHVEVALPCVFRADDNLVLPGAFFALYFHVDFTLVLRVCVLVGAVVLVALRLNFLAADFVLFYRLGALEHALGRPTTENGTFLTVLKELEVGIQLQVLNLLSTETRNSFGVQTRCGSEEIIDELGRLQISIAFIAKMLIGA